MADTNGISAEPRAGAHHIPGQGTLFRVWAPLHPRMTLVLKNNPSNAHVPMKKTDRGYFECLVPGAAPGQRYRFKLPDGRELPDPASRFQPDGVHGDSEIISSEFPWTDTRWQGIAMEDLVIYELHVGTFSPEGTFDGLIARLPYLKDLGVTAVELMPVAQFSGDRNWGYDGVYPYAVQNSYGGPEGLKRLVNACHNAGLAVILDVVYNHLGPEGNYLAQFGPYFQDKYRTPWGPALNFDDAHSDGVRAYFIQNALQWLTEFHMDALRLDAVHAIFDASAFPFLAELSNAKKAAEQERKIPLYLIAETGANDPRTLLPVADYGLGMDMHWNDDFHHTVHTLLTGETSGYYRDFGNPEDLCRLFKNGLVYTGQYSPFRKHRHGNDYSHPRLDTQPEKLERLVVYSQNHDQIGNRMNGERLITLAGEEKQQLAAALTFLSPFTPLLFMGEEYGETAPFLYFVHHEDHKLNQAVRKGRKEEFKSFNWQAEPPDPVAEDTFHRSKLSLPRPEDNRLNYYKTLIALSKWIRRNRILTADAVKNIHYDPDKKVLTIWAETGTKDRYLFLYSFSKRQVPCDRINKYEIIFNSNTLKSTPYPNLLSTDDLILEPYGVRIMKVSENQ